MFKNIIATALIISSISACSQGSNQGNYDQEYAAEPNIHVQNQEVFNYSNISGTLNKLRSDRWTDESFNSGKVYVCDNIFAFTVSYTSRQISVWGYIGNELERHDMSIIDAGTFASTGDTSDLTSYRYYKTDNLEISQEFRDRSLFTHISGDNVLALTTDSITTEEGEAGRITAFSTGFSGVPYSWRTWDCQDEEYSIAEVNGVLISTVN